MSAVWYQGEMENFIISYSGRDLPKVPWWVGAQPPSLWTAAALPCSHMTKRVRLSNFYDDSIINIHHKDFMWRKHTKLKVHLGKTEACQCVCVNAESGLRRNPQLLQQSQAFQPLSFCSAQEFSVSLRDQLLDTLSNGWVEASWLNMLPRLPPWKCGIFSFVTSKSWTQSCLAYANMESALFSVTCYTEKDVMNLSAWQTYSYFSFWQQVPGSSASNPYLVSHGPWDVSWALHILSFSLECSKAAAL